MAERIWAYALQGDRTDLDDAELLWTGDGPFRISRIQNPLGEEYMALFADKFNGLSSAIEVENIASTVLHRINGLLFLRDIHRAPLRSAGILERLTDGTYARHAVVKGAVLVGRIRIHGTGVVGDSYAAKSPHPVEQAWLAQAMADNTLSDVLIFLQDAPGWFDLWKAFEMMRDDVQIRSNRLPWHKTDVAWPSQTAMDRFEQTANHYRHSRAKRIPVPKSGWMEIEEGRRWVSRLVVAWLEWRQRNR
ncbi:hypothetical protein QWZ14_07295 [Paeniroseomonas aquatica]|uniref:Uncharacterized protein n=2 Tax=Paeniroseomonas aquatica TaxID=373043 RepID=A0ABT8A362_9PROT|nr:hypothetical protein [Paeniroseomonas aquatica]MDN3564177.1 hypothetical protein [Paeniroseomonas aquatica]